LCDTTGGTLSCSPGASVATDNAPSAVFSADSSAYAFLSASRDIAYELTSAPNDAAPYDLGPAGQYFPQLSWSTSGSSLLYATYPTAGSTARNWFVATVNGATLATSLAVPGGDVSPQWAGNGLKLFTWSYSAQAGDTLSLLDIAATTPSAVSLTTGQNLVFQRSPNGKLVVVGTPGTFELVSLDDPTLRGPAVTVAGAGFNVDWSWSPNSDYVLLTVFNTMTGGTTLKLATVNGTTLSTPIDLNPLPYGFPLPFSYPSAAAWQR
jgi:Tol biopolymer transport system component